jgi:hypothetical protein
MRQKTNRHQDGAERTIKDIRRQTRKRYSAEEKIRIVLAGLRGEDSIAELCRQEGIAHLGFGNAVSNTQTKPRACAGGVILPGS